MLCLGSTLDKRVGEEEVAVTPFIGIAPKRGDFMTYGLGLLRVSDASVLDFHSRPAPLKVVKASKALAILSMTELVNVDRVTKLCWDTTDGRRPDNQMYHPATTLEARQGDDRYKFSRALGAVLDGPCELAVVINILSGCELYNGEMEIDQDELRGQQKLRPELRVPQISYFLEHGELLPQNGGISNGHLRETTNGHLIRLLRSFQAVRLI